MSRVAVIGCGIFGAMSAIRLAEAGHDVTVFERGAEPLTGASYNNQNRLHLGFHYPRDEETARQCVRGFVRFKREFADCIVQPVENAYFIASEGSRTTADDYLAFAARLGVPYERLSLPAMGVRNVSIGIVVPEVVYDCAELRTIVTQRLVSIPCHFNANAVVERSGEGFLVGGQTFDAVVNCTYADANRINAALGYPCREYQYEYTAVPIVEWDHAPVGITIIDGPFMTVLPFGKTDRFLLYHVEHSVVAREIAPQYPWGTPPVIPTDLPTRMIEACRHFVPALATAHPVGVLQGPRVVLANRDATDARPSIVSAPEPRYVTVFSGKIDHCVDAADKVVSLLES